MNDQKQRLSRKVWLPYAAIGGLALFAGGWLWLQELDLRALRINRSEVTHHLHEMSLRCARMEGEMQGLQDRLDSRALLPQWYKQVIAAISAFIRLPREQATLETWEQQLAAHHYLALEIHALDYNSLQRPGFGASFLLAGVTEPTAPVFPQYDGDHFLLITECTYSTLFVVNLENQSISAMPRETFLEQWTGRVITLRPLLVI